VVDVTTYPVEGLVPSDPTWPELYARLAAVLEAELAPTWRIEHIGSTSVSGLLAKPVIDMAVRLPDGERLGDHTDAFRAAGWSGPVDLGSHDFMFLLDGTVRRAIAHVFTPRQWPVAHQRLFAAWLRRHSNDGDAYAQLKQDLYDRGVWGADYTESKTAFVQDIVDRARAEEGLAPISVWNNVT
jgi:GrpB-like predicted nucleotidyltransferase (UPF0157 family)